MAQHDEMVSKLNRDLRFFHTGSQNPGKLSRDQVRFYNEQGYLTGLRVFQGEQVLVNRENFDRILQKFIREGKDSYAIDRYQDKLSAVYDIATSPRILDYLDIHFYPQNGVALSPAGDANTQALRLRSTRALWDPTYADESWIAQTSEGPFVRLIPRMRDWVNNHYPGTKIALGEYNWGALDHLNGALAQADILGIFGRESLDLAALWDPPSSAQPGAYAFRMYRNYDGTGTRSVFGDVARSAKRPRRNRRLSDEQNKMAHEGGLEIQFIGG